MESKIQDYTFKILGIVEICGGEYKGNILQSEDSNYVITALCIETQRYIAIKIPELYISDSGIIQRGLLVAHELAIDKTDCGSLKIGDIITKDGKITKEQEFTFTITDIESISETDSIIIAICDQTKRGVSVLVLNTTLTDRVAIKKELIKEHTKLFNIIDKDITIKIGETI